MAMLLPEGPPTTAKIPAWRPDDKEYLVAARNGAPVKLYWSEMSLRQRRYVEADEQRAALVADCNPCGLY